MGEPKDTNIFKLAIHKNSITTVAKNRRNRNFEYFNI